MHLSFGLYTPYLKPKIGDKNSNRLLDVLDAGLGAEFQQRFANLSFCPILNSEDFIGTTGNSSGY